MLTTRDIERCMLRLYRVLLHAYPADFRARYQTSLLSDVADASREIDGQPVQRMLVWLGLLSDLLASAVPERVRELREQRVRGAWRWAAPLTMGLCLGAFRYWVGEVQVPLLVLVLLTFLVGVTSPARPWRWALLIGLGVPIAHGIGHMLPLHSSNHGSVIASGWALIPTFLSVYGGVLVRRAIRLQPHRFA
jgi:hypothetical protein